jgi:hypothetical protein
MRMEMLDEEKTALVKLWREAISGTPESLAPPLSVMF